MESIIEIEVQAVTLETPKRGLVKLALVSGPLEVSGLLTASDAMAYGKALMDAAVEAQKPRKAARKR